jgi:hypothetical protein
MENEELDPVEKAELDRIYQEEVAAAMEGVWSTIQKISMEEWIRSTAMSPDRKRLIMQRMIDWFAHPDREEYERCAELQKGLKRI